MTSASCGDISPVYRDKIYSPIPVLHQEDNRGHTDDLGYAIQAPRRDIRFRDYRVPWQSMMPLWDWVDEMENSTNPGAAGVYKYIIFFIVVNFFFNNNLYIASISLLSILALQSTY